MFVKRKGESTESDAKRLKRENCPHSTRCYRKNPHHFRQFEHPHLLELIAMGDKIEIPSDFPQSKDVYLEQIGILKPLVRDRSQKLTPRSDKKKPDIPQAPAKPSCSTHESSIDLTVDNAVKVQSETTMEKMNRTAPYNVFFTTVNKSPETQLQPNSITFTDLLCPSLGALKCSLQINFMIDIDWLLKQYKARNLHSKPLTILYGDDWPDMEKFIRTFCPNVTSKLVKMKDPFGCHHSKIGLYIYEDESIRVVVSTANLYYEDWNHYNQGLWISPACKRLSNDCKETDGESPTKFKSNLLNYLRSYKEPILDSFIEQVKKADFSDVKVFLVYSSPGKHYPESNGCHLHCVSDLLSRHCELPAKTSPRSEGPLSWGILAQASSVGSMGKKPADWLRGSLLRCLASHKGGPRPANSSASISIVYPSVDDVMKGYYGAESGGCLPYSKATNEKQRWLQELGYLYKWKASAFGRTRAMPHVKTYCRVSPCLGKLAYFLITSANLSKAAWGGPFARDSGVYVRSYEVGVLFVPRFFDEEYFEISDGDDRKNKALFPFMYDLPLTPYKKDDYPWCN